MLHVSLVMIALTGAPEECDRRATVAGELMILHQSGASAAAIEAAARAADPTDFALGLVSRVLAAEVSAEVAARELAGFHFAAEVHAECANDAV